MRVIEIFNSFAAAFESAVINDNWSRLEKYLAKDASYLNIGGADPKCIGRKQIIAYLKKDVSNMDRRFDTRTLIALSQPTVNKNNLSRQWRITYTLADTPDLIIEGEARYLIEENTIKQIEEQPTDESMQKVNQWMQKYADKLHQEQ